MPKVREQREWDLGNVNLSCIVSTEACLEMYGAFYYSDWQLVGLG